MAQSPLEEFIGSMTVTELADRSGKSVTQLVEWALAGEARAKKSPTRRTTGPKPSKSKAKAGGVDTGDGGKTVNTRTPDGRAKYDDAVFGAVSSAGKPLGSTAIRKKVGGTSLQLRTAVNRLIEAGKITYEGKARATVYSLR